MSRYIIKVSGVSSRDGAGEYDGGDTLADAKRKARKEFAPYAPHADIGIYTVTRNGDLKWAADVQSHPLGGRPQKNLITPTPAQRADPDAWWLEVKDSRSQESPVVEIAGPFYSEAEATRARQALRERVPSSLVVTLPLRYGSSKRDRGYTKRQFDAETKENWGRAHREYEREYVAQSGGEPRPYRHGQGPSATQYRRERRLVIPRGQNQDVLATTSPQHRAYLRGAKARLRGSGWYLVVTKKGSRKPLSTNGPYSSEAEAYEGRERILDSLRGQRNIIVTLPIRRSARDLSGSERTINAESPSLLARRITQEVLGSRH